MPEGVARLTRVEMARVLAAPGCPLCRLADEDDERYLRGVLREGSTASSLRQRLSEAGGFCRRHAWALQRLEQDAWQDGLLNGSLALPLLEEALAGLESQSEGRGRRRPRPRREAAVRCPACVAAQHMALARAAALCTALADDALADAFAARRQGLCLPHFRLTWDGDVALATRTLLLAVQTRQVRSLVTHLKGYLDKHHWHVTDPMSDAERSSWRDAVEMLAGAAPPGRAPADGRRASS